MRLERVALPPIPQMPLHSRPVTRAPAQLAQDAPLPAAALGGRGRTALQLACVLALVLTVAPAVLVAAGSPYGEVLRWFAQPICHQLAERSFHLLGEPLAVCQRCTGLYAGFALGVVVWPQLRRLGGWLAANPRWVLAFLLPLGIDWALQNTPLSRFATGLVAGFPVALLALLALPNATIEKEHNEDANNRGSNP